MGFLQICAGVVLLQMSKSAKDVPDAAVFKGDLDQVREIAEVEQPESEPKADALRGAASLIRRLSVSRQKMEQEEARRLREDQMKDHLEPLGENEIVEWDGLRRRKTVIGEPVSSPVPRRKTVHPPLGMSHFPDPNEDDSDAGPGFFEALRHRAQTVIRHSSPRNTEERAEQAPRSPLYPVALTDIKVHPTHMESPITLYGPGSLEDAQERIYGFPPGKRKEQDFAAHPSPRSKPLPAKPASSPSLRPPHETKRQFSFTNLLRPGSRSADADHEGSRPTLHSRNSSNSHGQKRLMKNATEEERLGLVKGDSHLALLQRETSLAPERPYPPTYHTHLISHSQSSSSSSLDEYYPDHYPSPTQRSRSNSDEDDGWQMTNVPIASTTPRMNLASPPLATVRVSTRRRPCPPRTYQSPSRTDMPPAYDQERPTAAPGAMMGGGPAQARATTAASDLSQTSSTNHSWSTVQSPATGSPREGGSHRRAQASEERGLSESGRSIVPSSPEPMDEYEASRRRFEEQSQREREERRQRAAGRRQSWKPRAPESAGASFI